MKRTFLALAAAAALAAPAGQAQAAQHVAHYPVWCGTTAMMMCGYCVEVNSIKNCTYF